MGKSLLISLIKVLFMMLLLWYRKYDSWEKFVYSTTLKFFFIYISSSVKKELFTFFMINFFFCNWFNYLFYFLQYQIIIYFERKKESKLTSPFLFLNIGIIKLSLVKVMETCFSSYSYKYFKENRSLPVTVFDKTFPTNFNFDNMFVFDFWCICSDTKNLVLLTGEILILFSSSFIRTAKFFLS